MIAPLGNEPRGLETPVPPPEEALSLAGQPYATRLFAEAEPFDEPSLRPTARR